MTIDGANFLGKFDTGSVSRVAGGIQPIADSLPSIGDSVGKSSSFFGDIGGTLTSGFNKAVSVFEDFELPDGETLRALSGLAAGVGEVVGGFRGASLQEFNSESRRLEAKLANESAALEKIRDKRAFLKLQGRNEAAAGASGLSGFDDIFIDDRTSFEFEQLIKKFNTEIFVFGKLREAENAELLAENEIVQGFAHGASTFFDAFLSLNPSKPTAKKKTGE